MFAKFWKRGWYMLTNSDNKLKKYILENLDCAHCASYIESAVKALPYVESVSIDFPTQSMLISTTDIDGVIKSILAIEPGVVVKAHSPKMRSVSNQPSEYAFRFEMILLGISLFLILMAFTGRFVSDIFSEKVSLGLFIAAYLIVGWNVLYDALRSIGKGSLFNENFLMMIATLGAFIIDAPAEAVSVMIFFKIGELFQERALHSSRRSIKALLEVRPDYANLSVQGELKRVDPDSVSVGDTVVIKPGEKIPMDGVITNGESIIDTSPLTGESRPVRVKTGDDILAGTINTSGMLTVKVTRTFYESSIAKILDLVENATHKKARAEKFMTTFARYYTPAIVALALAIAFIPPVLFADAALRDWVYKALVVLVISCPCALVISIPLGYFGGIGASSRHGILVKGSAFLDTLTRLGTIVFDKTGTLTHGSFKVTEVKPLNGYTEDELIHYAAHAEAHSSHPIAKGISEYYTGKTDPAIISKHSEISGFGVTATVGNKTVMVGNDRLLHEHDIPHDQCSFDSTVAHVVINNTYAGYILIGDSLKETTKDGLNRLRTQGVSRLVMLSGDNEFSVRATAKELGIKEFYADLLPENKVELLERILAEQTDGKNVAFVGDGINDAPVLTRADVGIAMGALGSDAAVETADIVLMDDSVEKVAEVIGIAKRTRMIVMQNIAMALSVKIAFVFLGLAGVSGMWEAVFADVGVALLAIVNAMRVSKL